jgi:hypothetical protein
LHASADSNQPALLPPCAVPRIAGVYHGGEAAAVEAVKQGRAAAMDFRLFCGACVWHGTELQREIDKGAW